MPYREIARSLARYLAARQRADGDFPGPDHYGQAAAIWLWSEFGDEFAGPLARARERLLVAPPADHAEFNAYALLHCRERLGPEAVDGFLRGLRFGQRHSANWMLLRAVCRALPGPWHSPPRAEMEARTALFRYARGGFIYDRAGVRSFTYHAFCGALLVNLWEAGVPWAGQATARAAACLQPFILPNGNSLYLGRGQEQIFGYGALLLLLEAAARMTGSEETRACAARVRDYLLRFRRADGSFPLVLDSGEAPEPWLPDPTRAGWYSYNRYADYLPFLACLLLKAEATRPGPVHGDAEVPSPPELRLFRNDRYTAVISAPGGPSTNDLAFPYLCVDGESLFPCSGREARVEPGELPLPYGRLSNGKLFAGREELRYQLTEWGLLGESRLLRHRRSFDFEEDGFTCQDRIAFLRDCQFREFTATNFLFRRVAPLPGGRFETRHGHARATIEDAPHRPPRPAGGPHRQRRPHRPALGEARLRREERGHSADGAASEVLKEKRPPQRRKERKGTVLLPAASSSSFGACLQSAVRRSSCTDTPFGYARAQPRSTSAVTLDFRPSTFGACSGSPE